MKQKTPKPKRLDITSSEVEALIKRAEHGQLGPSDIEVIRGMADTLLLLSQSVDQKSQSIKRLLGMLFGPQSEKASELMGRQIHPNAGDEDLPDHKKPANVTPEESPQKNVAPGHGKNGSEKYIGAERICVECTNLKHGERCPKCHRGHVYDIEPGTLVRITAEPPLSGKVIELQKLRCNTCGEIFTAEPPPGIGEEKYDSKSIAMMALLHYGTGMPFHRLEKLQESLGIPLPSSTQWDMVAKGAVAFYPVMERLIDEAAQGDLIHNDDTTARILDLMGKRKKDRPPDEFKPKRSGIFTTGLVSKLDGRRIVLFCTGTQHAGENLGELLSRRRKELSPPIQMCDGLAHNVPKELETILSNCVAHSRRKFVEILDNFPEECRHVILEMAKVYHNDAFARTSGMNDQERLRYHQQHSRSTMSGLKAWMREKFRKKEVEPNSGLGHAFNYTLKRWDALTLFLRKPGVPLDNNVCEQALKKSILTRKNSLFYKSKDGARVGDLYMSIIHTCELAKVNPFEYLETVLENKDKVQEAIGDWMPWTYKSRLVDPS